MRSARQIQARYSPKPDFAIDGVYSPIVAQARTCRIAECKYSLKMKVSWRHCFNQVSPQSRSLKESKLVDPWADALLLPKSTLSMMTQRGSCISARLSIQKKTPRDCSPALGPPRPHRRPPRVWRARARAAAPILRPSGAVVRQTPA